MVIITCSGATDINVVKRWNIKENYATFANKLRYGSSNYTLSKSFFSLKHHGKRHF